MKNPRVSVKILGSMRMTPSISSAWKRKGIGFKILILCHVQDSILRACVHEAPAWSQDLRWRMLRWGEDRDGGKHITRLLGGAYTWARSVWPPGIPERSSRQPSGEGRWSIASDNTTLRSLYTRKVKVRVLK